MKKTNAERETVFNIAGDDHKTLHVASDDPMWIRRLDKLASPVKVENDCKWYEFDLNNFNLTLRRKRLLTEEEKAKLRERAHRYLKR